MQKIEQNVGHLVAADTKGTISALDNAILSELKLHDSDGGDPDNKPADYVQPETHPFDGLGAQPHCCGARGNGGNGASFDQHTTRKQSCTTQFWLPERFG
jgi:hypothetical protein